MMELCGAPAGRLPASAGNDDCQPALLAAAGRARLVDGWTAVRRPAAADAAHRRVCRSGGYGALFPRHRSGPTQHGEDGFRRGHPIPGGAVRGGRRDAAARKRLSFSDFLDRNDRRHGRNGSAQLCLPPAKQLLARG
uniref:Predicted protein n=1 Tax=Physcomitrium patens TaxID=3218 RepID=A9U6A8_PHYPA